MVILFLIFRGSTILFSIVVAPFYISTSSTRGFQFLYIFANTCDFMLSLCFLSGVWWKSWAYAHEHRGQPVSGCTSIQACAVAAAGSVGIGQLAWWPCAQVHAQGRVGHHRELFIMFLKIIWINFVIYFKDKGSVY